MSRPSDIISKRELKRAEESMREKLRAKIRQRIHNPPNEGGDENVNTLNHEKSARPRRKHGRNASHRDELQTEKEIPSKTLVSKPKHGIKAYGDIRETQGHSYFDTKDSVEVHKKNRKNVLTDRRKETDSARPTGEYPRDRPYLRDKAYPRDKPNPRDQSCPVDTSTRLASRHKEKFDKRHQTERDGNHVEREEDGKSRIKPPLAPEALKPERMHHNSENGSVKSQKKATSSGKSEFLSSLVKLKDALQAHSKDQKAETTSKQSKKEPPLSIGEAGPSGQPCKDDVTTKKGSPLTKPLPSTTDDFKGDSTMWRITTTRKLAEFVYSFV